MFEDAARIPDGTQVSADVCVIGGGAAGITLARELAGAEMKVVILESGGEARSEEDQDLYRGTSTGLPYFPLEEARLRYFGGSTGHWGGFCRPFDAGDFATKPWMPFSGWPLSLDDVEPYYERSYEHVGITDDEWSPEAWAARSRFDPLPLSKEGGMTTRVAQLVARGPLSMADRHREELRTVDNVVIYLNANVTEIEMDEPGTSVTQVQAAVLSGPRFTVTARQFVLATGGIENPRLLLASRSRWPAGVGNHHDLVGRYFLEHPRFVAGVLLPVDKQLNLGYYEAHNVGDARIAPYLSFDLETQRREELVDVQLRLAPVYGEAFQAALESDDTAALRQAVGAARGGDLGTLGSHLGTVLGDLTTFRRYVLPGGPVPLPHPALVKELAGASKDEREALLPGVFGDIAASMYREGTGTGPVRQVDIAARIDPVPNRDSRVTLTSDRDELGMPRLALDWRLSDLDRHSVQRTMEMFAAEMGRSGVGRVRVTFDEAGTTWPEDMEGGWHHMGTTRMHDDPRYGVVDRDCKVHDVSNLYVAGSSVFPTSGSATPTLLIVALTVRLADKIRAAR